MNPTKWKRSPTTYLRTNICCGLLFCGRKQILLVLKHRDHSNKTDLRIEFVMSSPHNSAPEPTKLRHLTISAVKPVLESILLDYKLGLGYLVEHNVMGKLGRRHDPESKMLHPVVLDPRRVLTFILLTAPDSFFSRANVNVDELRYFMVTSDILDYKQDFFLDVKSGTQYLSCRDNFSVEASSLYGSAIGRNLLFNTMISRMEHVSEEPATGYVSHKRFLNNNNTSTGEGSCERTVRLAPPRVAKNKNKRNTDTAAKEGTHVMGQRKKKRTKQAPVDKNKKATTTPVQNETRIGPKMKNKRSKHSPAPNPSPAFMTKKVTTKPVQKESTSRVVVCVDKSNNNEHSPSDVDVDPVEEESTARVDSCLDESKNFSEYSQSDSDVESDEESTHKV